MSFWAQPTVAANSAVEAPMIVTIASVVGANSSIGDMRAIRNTPAVTIVAAWISAETGVGPSIASGSQTCSPIWADLPQAPTNSRMPITSKARKSLPKMWYMSFWCCAMAAKIVENSIEPNFTNTSATPTANATSAMRLTRNALIAAAQALGRSYQ